MVIFWRFIFSTNGTEISTRITEVPLGKLRTKSFSIPDDRLFNPFIVWFEI